MNRSWAGDLMYEQCSREQVCATTGAELTADEHPLDRSGPLRAVALLHAAFLEESLRLGAGESQSPGSSAIKQASHQADQTRLGISGQFAIQGPDCSSPYAVGEERLQ